MSSQNNHLTQVIKSCKKGSLLDIVTSKENLETLTNA